MAARGDEVRQRILWAAKDVFLELGFERASMDVLAARAATSKRTLYAHFENKDALFLAVLDLAQSLYLGRLRTPGDYAQDRTEAVVLFCGRFLQLLLWEPALRTCRLGIAEAERLPEASARYFDAIFVTSQDRLATFLRSEFSLTDAASAGIAEQLLARTIYPRLISTLYGVARPLTEKHEEDVLATDVDLTPIRRSVAGLLPPAADVSDANGYALADAQKEPDA